MFGKDKATASVQADAPTQRVAAKEDGTLANVLNTGTVHVSVQNPSKPFFFGDAVRPKGFNVDFMSILFAQSEFNGKIKVEAVPVETYADVPKQLLDSKKIDIAIDGLTFNDEDLNGVVYTIPYVKDFGYSLITARGNSIQSASDTTGVKIGVLQGDPDAKAFAEQAFPDAKIVELSDKVDTNGKWIVGHIKSGRVDAVVYDYPFAVAEVDGTDLQFAMAKIKGSDIQYRIGVRKEDKDLLTALNGAIRKAMDTPEYPELLKKYFMSTNVAAVRRASSGEVSYIVAKGDTLSTIAQTQMGDKMRFGDIQTRNNLANPNFVTIGQKLVIPSK
jgi:ABC-type amino acid transport substrate-binding protein